MPRSKPALSRIELLQGTLDFIILQSLRWGPRHGYGLVQHIRATSRGALEVDAGSLYPALHRLEQQGAVRADWETSANNQRVRVYRLTRSGHSRLSRERSRWEQLSEIIAGLCVPPTAEEA